MTHLVRAPGPLQALAPVLLLGGRGSGKSTLLAHLGQWAGSFPQAAADLEAVTERGGTRIDVLTRLAFQLSARKKDFPPLAFPSFGVLLMAVAAGVNQQSRQQAVRDMREALQRDRSQEHSYETLQALLEIAAAAGGPGWSTAVIPLLRGWQQIWARLRVRRLVGRVSTETAGQRATDFLIGFNLLYHGLPAQREEAEQVLAEAFLADLRAAYGGRGDRLRTTRCLVLLDNVDCAIGESFFRLLLDSRPLSGPGEGDPLLVVATARSRPEALIRQEPNARSPADYRESWTDGGEFQPVRVDRLRVARLRDLTLREVEERAAAVLTALPPRAKRPWADNPVQWLGWIVHELTRGHPAATTAVLDVLPRFPADAPWDERLRSCLAPPSDGPAGVDPRLTVAPQVLESLLRDCTEELRAFLPRAAAAVTLGQAETARELWEGTPPPRRQFNAFATDVLRTLPFEDGGLPAAHPLLRFLLLRTLDTAAGETGAGSWDGAHLALRHRAEARREYRTAAYHDLARGDLAAAVDYLRARFDEAGADEWCDDLAWIQRAPARWPRGLPERAHARYERLVGVARGDSPRRAITRLLAAGWITVHPHPVPYGELCADPLGDPYTDLYPDIAEEFLTLRELVGDEHDRHVFLLKAEQYRRKPWW